MLSNPKNEPVIEDQVSFISMCTRYQVNGSLQVVRCQVEQYEY